MTDERSNVIAADFRPHVFIAARGKVYDLGPDAVGQSMYEVFGEACPPAWRGAKRYMTPDGWVIVRPDRAE